MNDEAGQEPVADRPTEAPSTAPSTEIVLTQRRPQPVASGRLAHLVTGLRGQLVQLSRHPAAVASVSAATTIGGAVVVNALRRAARAVATRPAASTGSAVVGYVLHEVHVFHHVVAPGDRPPLRQIQGRQP